MSGLNSFRNSAIGLALSILPQACVPTNTQVKTTPIYSQAVDKPNNVVTDKPVDTTVNKQTDVAVDKQIVESFKKRLIKAIANASRHKAIRNKLMSSVSQKTFTQIQERCEQAFYENLVLDDEIEKILQACFEDITKCMPIRGMQADCVVSAILQAYESDKEKTVKKFEQLAKSEERSIQCIEGILSPVPHMSRGAQLAKLF